MGDSRGAIPKPGKARWEIPEAPGEIGGGLGRFSEWLGGQGQLIAAGAI